MKQALNMNGYPDWLINSIPTIQHFPEGTTTVSSDDTSDGVKGTEIDTTTKKTTSKKSPGALPYIKEVSEQIRSV